VNHLRIVGYYFFEEYIEFILITYIKSSFIQDGVYYNVFINMQFKAGRVDVALDVYRHILENAPFSPSPVTYRHLTKGLVDANRIQEAMDLLREMLNRGHGADSLVYNVLMQGFIDRGNMEKAFELFDELKERCLVYDGVVHATFMEAFWKQGKDKEAMENYQSLIDRQFNMSPATCNVLLTTLLKHDKDIEADKLFQNMLDRHNHPAFLAVNTETYTIMVNRKFDLGKFDEAIEVFHRTGRKPLQMDVGCFNNIIGKLCERGMVSEAEKLFEKMPSRSAYPDVVTYDLLVDACFRVGRVDDVLKYFGKMMSTDDQGFNAVKFDLRLYNKTFDGLVKARYIPQAMEIFYKMREKEMKPELKPDLKPRPDSFTFETLIGGLCKEGDLDRARDLLEEMLRRSLPLSSQFRQFVTETFAEAGRIAQIEQLFGQSMGSLPHRSHAHAYQVAS